MLPKLYQVLQVTRTSKWNFLLYVPLRSQCMGRMKRAVAKPLVNGVNCRRHTLNTGQFVAK